MEIKVFESAGIEFRANDGKYDYMAKWAYPVLELEIVPNPLAYTSIDDRIINIRGLLTDEMSYHDLQRTIDELGVLLNYIVSLRQRFENLQTFLKEIERRVKQC